MVLKKLVLILTTLAFICTTAHAATLTVDLTVGDGYHFIVEGASPGSNYVLLWLEGTPETPGSGSAADVVFIRQAKAVTNTVTFSGITPMPFTTATIFVIDGNRNVLYGGTLHDEILGDLNKDGELNPTDFDMMLDYLAGIISLPDPLEADINNDGVVDISDAQVLHSAK